MIYSSAIAKNNSEYCAAQERGIPLMQRAQALVHLMEDFQCIAVAGTHGKTTTTSLITSLLLAANMRPSYAIGGQLNTESLHADVGEGLYFVAEADESDASLHLTQKLLW